MRIAKSSVGANCALSYGGLGACHPRKFSFLALYGGIWGHLAAITVNSTIQYLWDFQFSSFFKFPKKMKKKTGLQSTLKSQNMSSMGVWPLLGAQGGIKWSIFIKLAYNGHSIARIDQKHEFANRPTFLKKKKNTKVRNKFTSPFLAFKMRMLSKLCVQNSKSP